LKREPLFDEKIGIIHNFLSVKECKDIIQRAENDGFKKSVPGGGGHGRTGKEEARDNKYTVITDQTLADCYWERVKELVPKDLSFIESSPYFGSAGGIEWKACGLVDRFRVYKYEVNEHYPEHMDGCYKRTVVNSDGETYQQQSFLTLLMYLNDGFQGGETRFWTNKQHCRFLREVEDKIPTVIVEPKRGSALVNIHSVLHEGCPVISGTKYVVRTDILYTRSLPQHPKLAKFNPWPNGKKQQGSVSEWEKIFEPSCKMYHD